MRRLTLALALMAMTLVGTALPSALPASASTPAGVSRGSVTLTVGPDSFGLPTWTVAFSGSFSAAGQSYAGSATGTGSGGHNFLTMTSLAGSSSTGTLSGSCNGEFVEVLPWTIVGGPPPAVLPDHNFTGAIDFNCWVSINGRPQSGIGLLVGLLPTADPQVFKGLYTETPDITTLPTLPLLSGGTAGAATDSGFGVDPAIGFEYTGQITLGGQTFHGDARGGVDVQPATSVAVPPFPLANSPDSADTLSATCSGQWQSTDMGVGVGVALSILTCNGSVSGGPAGTATLVSVYAETSTSVRPGETAVGYSGVFAGL